MLSCWRRLLIRRGLEYETSKQKVATVICFVDKMAEYLPSVFSLSEGNPGADLGSSVGVGDGGWRGRFDQFTMLCIFRKTGLSKQCRHRPDAAKHGI